MSLIQVENLTFSYPGSFDNIFEHVSFQMDTDWKLGFVGRNGRGKTTFLRLLLGQYEYGGTISASVEFDYFPYPVRDPKQSTEAVLREVCPDAEPWELLRELALLEVEEAVLARPYETLSGGERTKVLLAALFLKEGHFLLIDEPTNHLDARARQRVSAYLRRKKGFLLVSHDRRFLDGCVDHILALNRTGIEVRHGSFSSWMEDFQHRQEAELQQRETLQKDIRRLKQAARRTSDWSDRVEKTKYGSLNSGLKVDRGFVGHKSAKMMKRAKSIEARQQRAVEEKEGLLKNRETAEALKLSPLVHYASALVSCTDLEIRYGEIRACGPVSLTVRQGERVALEGRNGCGKSSLLKLLAGQDLSYTGELSRASGLQISYVPQDTSHLRGSLADYAREQHIDESLFKAILRKMDFQRLQFEKDMADFSDGQKKKVLIAQSLCRQAHLYLWDEPLNFIDLYSRMQIEALLREFSPTMLFVEHDRAFQEAVATRTVRL